MPHMIIMLFALLCSSPSWAEEPIQPLFQNDLVNMTYPSVSGDYLVYAQRISFGHQIVRLNKLDYNLPAKAIEPMFAKDMLRNGVALANGDIAYVSNRIGGLAPWIQQQHKQSMPMPDMFQSALQANHLNSNSIGSWWVFDSTLQSSRSKRIADQFADAHLHQQLLGQAWRAYHEKYWIYKSAYPASQTGLANKFQQPKLFLFEQASQQLSMLGNGFDADVSNDGKHIVFVRETAGNFDIWLQNTDGTGLQQLTHNQYADVEPSFSADGKYIAFVSNRDSLGDIKQTFIYTLELATGKQQAITSGMGVVDGGPSWLNDNTIIFHSNRDYKAPQQQATNHWSLWTAHTARNTGQ